MFYELKYDVTVYDVPVATMLPFTRYNLLSYDFAVLPQKLLLLVKCLWNWLQVQSFCDVAKRKLNELSWEFDFGAPENANNILPIIKRTAEVSPYFSTSGELIF